MLRNGLEPWHLLLVAIIVILLFGSKKLPEAARGLGKSLRILKSETKAMKEDGKDHSPASAPFPADDAATSPAPRIVQAAPDDAISTPNVSHNTAER
jgi:sec-independent protein translocase protein TatA